MKTFKDVAEMIGVDPLDLWYGEEDMFDEPIYRCDALDGLVENMTHEEMPELRAINEALVENGEKPFLVPYR